MSIEELGNILRDMCKARWGGGKVVAIHLFGIQYRQEIEAVPGSGVIPRIVEHSGIGRAYQTEVSKGIRLEPNVALKKQYRPNKSILSRVFRR